MRAFQYHKVTTPGAAVALASADPEAMYLAGGHSLVPAMKAGTLRPSCLVDLSGLTGAAGVYVEDGGTEIRIGAMTRHEAVATDLHLRHAAPGLAGAPAAIGDPHVRLSGTIGGSLAANMPGADLPTACLAHDARIETDQRLIDIADFFDGPGRTILAPAELIRMVHMRAAPQGLYLKIAHPASGFALVSACVLRHRDKDWRVAVAGLSARGPMRATGLEAQLNEDPFRQPQAAFGELADPLADPAGSNDYRQHLATVLVNRAAQSMLGGQNAG